MRARTLAAVVVTLAVLSTGCGGKSAPSSRAAPNGALAFARCMRAHGIPGWPDPQGDGGFDKAKLRALDLNVAEVRSLEEGPCNQLQGAQPPAHPITPAQRGDYLRAAACMRAHGYPQFPDPTFPGSTVRDDLPSSIDQNAPRFRSAASICTRLIPAGLPYSGRRS